MFILHYKMEEKNFIPWVNTHVVRKVMINLKSSLDTLNFEKREMNKTQKEDYIVLNFN